MVDVLKVTGCILRRAVIDRHACVVQEMCDVYVELPEDFVECLDSVRY